MFCRWQCKRGDTRMNRDDLKDPNVDEDKANEYIRRACEKIQRTWSESERRARLGSRAQKFVEITVVEREFFRRRSNKEA